MYKKEKNGEKKKNIQKGNDLCGVADQTLLVFSLYL